jgi:hypothetical protein
LLIVGNLKGIENLTAAQASPNRTAIALSCNRCLINSGVEKMNWTPMLENNCLKLPQMSNKHWHLKNELPLNID